MIHALPSNVPDFFELLLERLERDHGKEIVERLFCLLACSRYGLTANELRELMAEIDEASVHQVILRQIGNHLHHRGDLMGLMGFYHRDLSKAVQTKYLSSNDHQPATKNKGPDHWHSILARYFMAKPIFLDDKNREDPNVRKLIEQPWQQIMHGNMWDDVAETLCDLWFIEAKIRAGLVHKLQEDYRLAFPMLPEVVAKRREKEKYQRRMKKYAEDLMAYARGDIAHLDIVPPIIPWCEKQLEKETARILKSPTRVERLEDFAHFVNAESQYLEKPGNLHGFCIQQAYNYAASGPVVDQAERIIEAKGINGIRLLLKTRTSRPDFNFHQAKIMTLKGHREPVNAVCIAADGNLAVTASDDKTLKVWDLENGTCLKTLKGHTGAVKKACITPDGNTVVSESSYRKNTYIPTSLGGDSKAVHDEILVWDVKSGKCLKTLNGYCGSINALSITPDGNRAISGSWDNTLKVWDLSTGICIKTIKRDHDYGIVIAVSIIPDGSLAILGSGFGMDAAHLRDTNVLEVWDIEKGKCVKILQRDIPPVKTVSVTPGGRRAASVGNDATIRIWDLEKGTCLKEIESGPAESVYLTPGGRIAVTGSTNLKLWDVWTGKCLKSIAFSHPIRFMDITPDGRKGIVALTFPAEISFILDLEKGTSSSPFMDDLEPTYDIAISPNGKLAVSVIESFFLNSEMRIWNVETGKCLKTLRGHSGPINSVCISSDSKKMVSGSSWNNRVALIRTPNTNHYSKQLVDKSDDMVKYWDLENGDCIRILGTPSYEGFDISPGLRVNAVAVTPDNRRAVSGKSNLGLDVWDLASGVRLMNLEERIQSVHTVNIMPDGRTVITGNDGAAIQAWDIENGVCLKTLKEDKGPVNAEGNAPNTIAGAWVSRFRQRQRAVDAVRIAPDGIAAVLKYRDGMLKVWNLINGSCLKTLNQDRASSTRTPIITPDGRNIITRGDNNTIKVLGLDSGKWIGTLKVDTSIYAMCITPDGKTLLSSSADKAIRIWDLEKGICDGIYYSDSSVNCMDIHPLGNLSGGTDNVPIFIRPINLMKSVPICTPRRVWRFGPNKEKGHWDANMTTNCRWCGSEFAVSEQTIDVIKGINRGTSIDPDESPCLKLPKEAWGEPGLLSECPNCKGKLKFNPFMVDNRRIE